MIITPILAKTTSTSAAAGATEVDIAALGSIDWTIVLEVMAAGDTTVARFAFEDSVNNFAAALAGPTASISGKISAASAPRRFTFKKADFPALRFGTASAELRLNLTQILGTSPTVTYQAWLEY